MKLQFHLIISLVLIITLFSCGHKVHEEAQEPEQKCYLRLTSNGEITDSLIFEVTLSSDSIYGELNWLPQEKDSQRGVIKGHKTGNNRYQALYIFNSEGTSNEERQTIIFKDKLAFIIRETNLTGNTAIVTDTLLLTSCSGK